MRKHDVRKWLHAILDLLPVILIPVFMIYSHRHDINSYEVEVEKQEVINFNQLVQNNNSNLTDIEFSSGYLTNTDRIYVSNFISGHVYALRFTMDYDTFATIDIARLRYPAYTSNLTNGTYTQIISSFNTTNYIGWQFRANDSVVYNANVLNIQLFDLTQMFGVGNEPSAEVFDTYFTESYYDYTLSHKELLNVGTITYNDTDIVSQLLYTMYNATDKYFNFNKMFNFNQIYNWFNLNLFGGNPPLVVPVVWNIILYEFIMDIIFLTYMIFMFIIDFAEHLIECFFDKSYKGGK